MYLQLNPKEECVSLFFEPKTAREAPAVKYLLKGSEKIYKAKQQKGRDNKTTKGKN
jgi:hypothetical protein